MASLETTTTTTAIIADAAAASPPAPSVGLWSLPREILHDIFERLRAPELLSLRLQDAYLSSIATALAFRRLRVVAYGSSPLDLIRVARSENLRGLVQEITCDTSIDPLIQDFRAYGYRQPTELLKALEFLRHFRHLRTLHLRFTRDYWTRYDGEFESVDFRLRVLHTVFSCISGLHSSPIDWGAQYQDESEHEYHDGSDDEVWSDDDGEDEDEDEEEDDLSDEDEKGSISSSNSSNPQDEEEEGGDEREEVFEEDGFFDLRQIPSELLENPPPIPAEPIHLTSLTIANLAAERDARLLKNPVFSRVLSQKSLQDLKLLITPSVAGIGGYVGRRGDRKIAMYKNLPTTWLSPSTVANLRELSLYSLEYWGWYPKLDLRELGSLPNLKVLALGQYVFSHQWQMDWIASLNLEELYLDRCGILHQVETWTGWVDGSSAYLHDQEQGGVVGGVGGGGGFHNAGQEAFLPDATAGAGGLISNEGYLNPEWRFMTRQHGYELVLNYPLRWHDFFDHWRKTMTTLKVFRIGAGAAWRAPPAETINANYSSQSEGRQNSQRFIYNAFRYYKSPPPGGKGDQYREGTGLCESHEHALQYLYFERFGFHDWEQWDTVERFRRNPSNNGFTDWHLEDGLRERDAVARDLFIATVNARTN